MLVLSRQLEETIVFPQFGITVRVLRLHGNVVRLGIEAPEDVRVLRGELVKGECESPLLTHALRNKLNKISLNLHLAQRHLNAGRSREAELILANTLEDFPALSTTQPQDLAATAAQTKRRLKTLIVDDDSNERELLAGVLSMNGCDCATASDGLAALEYLECHERPDYLLLDMRMPRCDGPGTLGRIRQDPKLTGMRVIAISGSSPSDVGMAPEETGVDAWFVKPLNPAALWDLMRSQSSVN